MAMLHLLEDTLPINSIKIGRLLLNPKQPQQQFIDPLDLRPTGTEINHNDQQTLTLPKNHKIPPYLTTIASLSISHSESLPLTATLTIPGATSYTLKNPAAWFRTACCRPPTREFLEEAFDNQDDVYLIVGFRIIKDPGTTGTKIRGTTVTPSNPMSSSAGSGVGHPLEFPYKEPGEHIFTVLYHKVQFQCLSSLYVNTATLEEDNRWVSTWCWRGPVQQYELAEEDNVIEAILMGLDDTNLLDEKDGSTRDLMEWAPDLLSIVPRIPDIPKRKEDNTKRTLEKSADDEPSKRLRSSFTIV